MQFMLLFMGELFPAYNLIYRKKVKAPAETESQIKTQI